MNNMRKKRFQRNFIYIFTLYFLKSVKFEPTYTQKKNVSSNKIVWLTVFGWFNKTFFLSWPNFCSVNQTGLLESFSWLYQIFYWSNQVFWLNISNNIERAFRSYNTHHELRQQIVYKFVYMHFVWSHGLS